jgi:hypothetical protein
MTKSEFLQQQTQDVIEVFEKYGDYAPTFAVLYDDGTTDSFATSFNGQEVKENFDYFMRKICTNPKVIASVFTVVGWVSKTALRNSKRPSECDDKEEVIMLLYCTRDNGQEMHLYKPDKNRKLELTSLDNSYQGRFCNPFLLPCLTKLEKVKLVNEFQENIRDSLCRTVEELQNMGYWLFLLIDSQEQLSVRQLTEEEWANKKWLKQTLRSRCREHKTLAFILAFPEKNDLFSVVLITQEIQEVFSYRINSSTMTLKFLSRRPYFGEFSGYFEWNQDMWHKN